MIVAFDNAVLTLAFKPDARPPLDTATGQPVARCRDRIEHLFGTLVHGSGTIVIPTPALAEMLIGAGDIGPQALNYLRTDALFRISSFDERAAIEAATQLRLFLAEVGKSNAGSTWPKVRYDHQIVAIAKVEGASVLYTDDVRLRNYAQRAGLGTLGIAELPLPPEPAPDLFD